MKRIFPLYDNVVLYPPAYSRPTVPEMWGNPDGRAFTKAAHVFAGTWVEENRTRPRGLWAANE